MTVTLRVEMVGSIDRLERNRSRFIMEAVENELIRGRREDLLRSLENPHVKKVVMTPRRPALPALAELPPRGVWWLQTKSQEADAEAIADGIRRLLETPGATPVVDRMTHATRATAPEDVAVLVATNAEGERVTAALARHGIRASIARAGLLQTPEGSLVEAALGCVADGRDSRSRALVDALTGFGGAPQIAGAGPGASSPTSTWAPASSAAPRTWPLGR